MADKNYTITHEVDNRLDELFLDEEKHRQQALEDEPPVFSNKLRDLKAVVLSIDWEINDEIMNSLMKQIESLKLEYKDDRLLLLFLQLLESVGKYIKISKANSHPDSIKLLNSIFRSLEKVVSEDKLPYSRRKKMLQAEVNRFKELKQQIALRRRRQGTLKEKEKLPESVGEPEKAPSMDQEEMSVEEEALPAENARMYQEFATAVEEIKEVIKSEFKALRGELNQWRMGQ